MGKHFVLMEVEQWVSQQKGKMPTVKGENDVKWVTGSFISHKTDRNMTHKETHTNEMSLQLEFTSVHYFLLCKDQWNLKM